MANKIRADQLALSQGLAESREAAKRMIMAGEIVFAGHSSILRVEKPGQLLSQDTRLERKPGKIWVSRGAYKLLTLLDGFNLEVHDLVCVDAGASTGGFTDCLLQRGASRVYAIDVGKNQLHEKLRNDPRVVNLEGINLRYAPRTLVPEKADFITGDVSFISLTLVLPALLQWLKPQGLMGMLIKPQFELGPGAAIKGVVRNEEKRQEAVRRIKNFCEWNLGLKTLGILPAALKGPKGNQEYMALFQQDV